MSELFDFQLAGDPEELRKNPPISGGITLSPSEYFAFLTDWTERMFPGRAPREGPVNFDRPFELPDLEPPDLDRK